MSRDIHGGRPTEYPESTASNAFRFLQLLYKAIDPRVHWQTLYRDHVGYGVGPATISPNGGGNSKGHGEALVRLNFWFFLFVYYGFYNTVGLLWVTKLFNIYSMNWSGVALRFSAGIQELIRDI